MNGAKRRKKAVIPEGWGTISHWAALSGFPSRDEGRNADGTWASRGACGGGSKGLGPAPTALGLSPSQRLSLAGAGGFMASRGWVQTPGFVIPPPLITVGLPAVQSPLSSTGLQLWGGGRMLGKVPQVTEQTAPSPPQHPRGWRETRFWFLRLHEHTEVHVLP